MAVGIPKGPDIVHPTIPGAVGSRNSTAQEGRDKVAEAKLIIEDAAECVRVCRPSGDTPPPGKRKRAPRTRSKNTAKPRKR